MILCCLLMDIAQSRGRSKINAEQWRVKAIRVKLKKRKLVRNVPHRHFFRHKSTWSQMGLNLRLSVKTPAPHRPCCSSKCHLNRLTGTFWRQHGGGSKPDICPPPLSSGNFEKIRLSRRRNSRQILITKLKSLLKITCFHPSGARIVQSVQRLATGLVYRGVGVRVPVGSRIFTFPYRPDRLWGPPKSPNPLVPEGSFTGRKTAGA
jgi:hypothetical protein